MAFGERVIPVPSGTAFGAPGIGPTWAAGDKDIVIRALGAGRVWATVGGGVLNEVFWPTTSRPQLRDLGFIVTGTGFWVEVKRAASYTILTTDAVVPLSSIVHHDERFTLTLMVVCDPDRDAVVISYQLEPLVADSALALHILVAPHLGGTGHGNDAWIDAGLLHASRNDEHLAVIADSPFGLVSAGYVGVSDGWQDINLHGQPTWSFRNAVNGNVALTASLLSLSGRIAVGFATTAAGARTLAVGAVNRDFQVLVAAFRADWERWAAHFAVFHPKPELDALARTSAMVLKAHEDVTFPGAIVASLATPWGSAHDDPGGYHLVWPRDCAETGLALLAIGLHDDAARTVGFLASTQSSDGQWPQNFTPGGEPFWTGKQLDEAALPIILAAKLAEKGVITNADGPIRRMVRNAAAYIAAAGPFTEQDRWEEAPGASPFTIAAVIVALAAAATGGWLDSGDSSYALSLADWWNSRIEDLTYVQGTELDREHNTDGHYERIARSGIDGRYGPIVLANRGGETFPTERLVGLEALALVRYGLRRPDDPRILDTVKIIDATLRVDTSAGPLYHRYQNDGYGEHQDGSPFNGTGIGRLWPLLTGERAHYALAVGEPVEPYLAAIAASTSAGNLLPEQVWDNAAIPERRLFPGRPSGSATPLVWAHAEYLKLLAAIENTAADQIEAVAAHYAAPPPTQTAHIRDELLLRTSVTTIIIEDRQPFRLHFGTDGWSHPTDMDSVPLGLGRHGVTLSREALGAAHTIEWTRFEIVSGEWEHVDHTIVLLTPIGA